MSTSLVEQISIAIRDDKRIPEDCIAYFEQRAMDQFYDFVLTKLDASRKASGLTKAKLAKRIGRGPEQVNRLLAYPGNWTINTVTRLLLGISGDEATLNSLSIFNRPSRNLRMEDMLDDNNIPKISLGSLKSEFTSTSVTAVVIVKKALPYEG